MSHIDSLNNENICYLDFGGKHYDVKGEDRGSCEDSGMMIPVYGLLSESKNEIDFVADIGEFVIGGGGGEHPGLVVNIYDTLLHMGVIDNDVYSKLIDDGVIKVGEGFRQCMNWDADNVYNKRKHIERWGYKPSKHDSIRWFFSVNLVSFLYHKFKFEIPYLPDYKFELPEDEALQGKMFSHYTESIIEPGSPKEWYQSSGIKSYFISLQELREKKIADVIQ